MHRDRLDQPGARGGGGLIAFGRQPHLEDVIAGRIRLAARPSRRTESPRGRLSPSIPSRFSGARRSFAPEPETASDFSLAPVLPYSGASVTVTCFSGSTTAWSSFPCNAAANSYDGVHATFRMTAIP